LKTHQMFPALQYADSRGKLQKQANHQKQGP